MKKPKNPSECFWQYDGDALVFDAPLAVRRNNTGGVHAESGRWYAFLDDRLSSVSFSNHETALRFADMVTYSSRRSYKEYNFSHAQANHDFETNPEAVEMVHCGSK